jgi:hypothetical protein
LRDILNSSFAEATQLLEPIAPLTVVINLVVGVNK